MDEAGKSAWCRENGVYPQELGLAAKRHAGPGRARGGPRQPAADRRQDKRRIKELERELRRKDKALAETAALLVLSKKVAAIFNKDEDE
jgi:transposase